jgi:hypothetical protein
MRIAVILLCAISSLSLAVDAQNIAPNQTPETGTHSQQTGENANDPTARSQLTQRQPQQPTPAEKETNGQREYRSEIDWWARISNVLIAAGTLILAVIGICGVWSALETLRAIRRQAETMDRTLRLDQRAWMGVVGIQITSPLSPDSDFVVEVKTKNTGKTPALKVESFNRIQALAPSDGVNRDFGRCDGNGTVMPDSENVVSIGNGRPVPSQIFFDVKDEARIIYLHGRIQYEDIFGDSHWTDWCFRLVGMNLFVSCDRHSDTDESDRESRVDRPGVLRATNSAITHHEEGKGEAQAKSDRHYRLQDSTRRAAWSAFGAAAIYAVISVFMWCEMRRTNLIATDTLHFAYRPQVVMDSMTGVGIDKDGANSGRYRIAWEATNYGTVTARNIEVSRFYEVTPSRESATKLPYQEVADNETVMAPGIRSGRTVFLELSDGEKEELRDGQFLTVSIRITYKGIFPNVSYYAEGCTSFNTSGHSYSGLDNAPCSVPMNNGWKESKNPD